MTVYLNPVNQKVWDVMQDSAYLTPIDVAHLKQRRASIAGKVKVNVVAWLVLQQHVIDEAEVIDGRLRAVTADEHMP